MSRGNGNANSTAGTRNDQACINFGNDHAEKGRLAEGLAHLAFRGVIPTCMIGGL